MIIVEFCTLKRNPERFLQRKPIKLIGKTIQKHGVVILLGISLHDCGILIIFVFWCNFQVVLI